MTQRIGASRTKNRPCILRFSHTVPSWLLGCGVIVCLTLIPVQSWAQLQPVILRIVPAQPAPGQVVTIQGHSLFLTTSPTATVVTVQISGALPPSGNATVIPDPSNANEVYVRMPEGFSSGGSATLNLKVNNIPAICSFDNRNTCSFQVADEPAAPIPRKICDTSLVECPEITSAVVREQRIGIQAFGTDINTDISEVTAVFSQGAEPWPAPLEQTFSNSVIGVVNEFIVPENLESGPALVQLEVKVGDTPSKLSFALRLTIQ